MDDLFKNKYVFFNKTKYLIVEATNKNKLFLSLFNTNRKKFLRVYNNKIIESTCDLNPSTFNDDSSFLYEEQDGKLLFFNADKENRNSYIYRKISGKNSEYFLSTTEKTLFHIESDNHDDKILEIKKFYHKNSFDFFLVSIIICNLNGYNNLIRLFDSFDKSKFYKNFEIIVVDNGSNDKSIDFLERQKSNYNLTIIFNKKNESFSKANNQGSKIAKGKYLIFLNNDVTVTDGWIDALLEVAFQDEKAGAIGAKLIYPYIPEGYSNHKKSFLIQHAGISFKNDHEENIDFVRPFNRNNGDKHLINGLYDFTSQVIAVTAACMLIKKDIFNCVGGFDENYFYGYEDVDICLKLYKHGYHNYYCPSCVLFHFEFGTQSNINRETLRNQRLKNHKYYIDKWNTFISYHLNDFLNGLYISTVYRDTIFNDSKIITGAIGIQTKIKNQICQLSYLGPISFYNPVKINKNKFCYTLDRFHLKDYSFSCDINFKNFNYIYIRKPNVIDDKFIEYLSTIKKCNAEIVIILEIPTYPYDKEYNEEEFVYVKAKDIRNQLKLHNYIDAIATYSEHDYIFNIKTIKISNGVDCSRFSKNFMQHQDDGIINIIACANITYWHGYDRIIHGLNIYSKTHSLENIRLHIVGDGPALDELKKLVNNYKLNDTVKFYGPMFGDDLNTLYNKCQIGIDSLGRHRSGITYNSSLKGKEYTANGLLVVSAVKTELDKDNNYEYYMRIKANDSPVEIDQIINFYNKATCNGKKLYDVKKYIYEYACTKFDFSKTFQPVIDYLKSTIAKKAK